MSANERQVGGDHYQTPTVCPHCKGHLQHWDLARIFNWDYFQGQITKYVMRWRAKNKIQDLEKAAHFLEKYIELNRELIGEAGPAYTNQDPLKATFGYSTGLTSPLHKKFDKPTP